MTQKPFKSSSQKAKNESMAHIAPEHQWFVGHESCRSHRKFGTTIQFASNVCYVGCTKEYSQVLIILNTNPKYLYLNQKWAKIKIINKVNPQQIID